MRKEGMFKLFGHSRKVVFPVLMSFCMAGVAFAQKATIKGHVVDENGMPIIGANILVKGTTNGTITDLDGNYSLEVENAKNAVLQISFIGYNSLEEAVKGRNQIAIKLEPSVVNLGEVVAIGYGTQTRREITGSVANISEESFNKGVTRGASDQTSHVLEVGYPVGQFYVLKCNGIDEEGHFIYEDLNGDGTISEADRTYCGDAQPDLTYGWTNTFSWKNWDASIFFRGTIGNKVLNNPLAAYGNNTYLSGANAIDNEDLLKLRENSQVSSYYIEDASFLRLDNMSIGYTFDTKKIDWLEKARVYVAAQNLFVITGYSGLDPEVENYRGEASDDDAGLSPGIEPRNYMPKARSFTFGVNLTF